MSSTLVSVSLIVKPYEHPLWNEDITKHRRKEEKQTKLSLSGFFCPTNISPMSNTRTVHLVHLYSVQRNCILMRIASFTSLQASANLSVCINDISHKKKAQETTLLSIFFKCVFYNNILIWSEWWEQDRNDTFFSFWKKAWVYSSVYQRLHDVILQQTERRSRFTNPAIFC